MEGQPTWTDCDEAGDYVVPNVLSPRDLVSRPDIMDETVPHTTKKFNVKILIKFCDDAKQIPDLCHSYTVRQRNWLCSVNF